MGPDEGWREASWGSARLPAARVTPDPLPLIPTSVRPVNGSVREESIHCKSVEEIDPDSITVVVLDGSCAWKRIRKLPALESKHGQLG